jgi:hypothetical protein
MLWAYTASSTDLATLKYINCTLEPLVIPFYQGFYSENAFFIFTLKNV